MLRETLFLKSYVYLDLTLQKEDTSQCHYEYSET